MEKKLILEIKRMQEIMGVKNSLLEAQLPPGSGQIAEEGAEAMWRSLRKMFGSGLERTSEKITERELEEVVDRMRGVVGDDAMRIIDNVITPKAGERALTAAEKEENILYELARNEYLNKKIVEELKLNDFYYKELQEGFDKFFSNSDVESQMGSMYKDAIVNSNGNIEDAKEMMRRIYEPVLGKDRMDRYFEITNVAEKNGDVIVKTKDEIRNKFADEVKNKPKAMQKRDRVIKFQDWMDENYPTWFKGQGKVRGTNAEGTFDSETERAWNQYKDEFSKSLSFKEKIEFVDYKAVAKKDIERWDKFWSGNFELLKTVRTIVGTWLKSRKGVEQEEKIINDFFGKLKTQVDEVVKKGVRDVNSKYISPTVFESLNTDLYASAEGGNFDELIESIKNVLREGGVPTGDVDFVVSTMKLNNPFEEINIKDPGRQIDGQPYKYRGWIKKFIDNETTWGFYKMRTEGATTKAKILEGVKRVLNVFSIGTFKTPTDMLAYFKKWGKKGYSKLWLDLNVATHVVVPILYGIYSAVYNLVDHLLGDWLPGKMRTYETNSSTEFFKDILGQVEEKFVKSFGFLHLYDMTGSVTLGVGDAALSILCPIHMYWVNWVLPTFEKAGRTGHGEFDGALLAIRNDVTGRILPSVKNYLTSMGYQWDESKDDTENVTAGFEWIVENRAASVQDTEPGFRFWCAKNGKIFKDYTGSTSTGFVGITEDGKNWQFKKMDNGQNTFVEVAPMQTTTTTQQDANLQQTTTTNGWTDDVKNYLITNGANQNDIVDITNKYKFINMDSAKKIITIQSAAGSGSVFIFSDGNGWYWGFKDGNNTWATTPEEINTNVKKPFSTK